MRPLCITCIALAPYLAPCRRWVYYSRHPSLVSGSPPGLSITPSFLPLLSTNQGSKELFLPLPPWLQTFGGSCLYIQELAGPSESSPAGKSLTVAESISRLVPLPTRWAPESSENRGTGTHRLGKKYSQMLWPITWPHRVGILLASEDRVISSWKLVSWCVLNQVAGGLSV